MKAFLRAHIPEAAAVIVQILLFYGIPLLAGPTDAIAMVLSMLFWTTVLSALLGGISASKLKFLHPVVAALVFMPSLPLYYNNSAWAHVLWYFTVSAIGLLLGTGLRFAVTKLFFRKK